MGERPRIAGFAGVRRAQFGAGGAERHDRRYVLETGAPGPFLIAADEERFDAQATPHQQRADAGRAAELVRAHRQQVGAQRREVDGDVTRRLRGINVHEQIAIPAGLDDRGDRLHGAHLVVGPLHVDEGGVGAERRDQRIDIDATDAVDRHAHDRARTRRGLAHGRMLDGRQHLLRPPRSGAPTRGRDRFGRAGREHHFA